MKTRYFFLLTFLTLAVGLGQVFAQNAYDLQFVVVKNDAVVDGDYDVKVQIQSSGGTFELGSSNLVFTYNTTGLNTPTKLSTSNFSGSLYDVISVTEPALGRVSINIVLFVPNNGTTVLGGWMDVATINFKIAQPTLTADFAWRLSTPNVTNVVDDDQTLPLATPNNLIDFNGLLPVELSSFTHNVFQNKVSLSWVTQTETNNLGFEIERSTADSDFKKVGFVEGNGTTVVAQSYSFEDRSLQPGAYNYRLRQVDLDGAFDYSQTIQVEINAPKSFSVAQNYPNPFNPETKIDYTLPEDANVSIAIYNLKGQLISRLVSGQQTTGFHSVNWNGRNDSGVEVASGVYVYSISAGKFRESRKLTFIR